MTTKRNYNEIDDAESGFGSAESDHSPPEVKNFRFENGDIIDDQDGGGQATTRTSARIVQRTKDELKESGNELTEEAVNAIQNDHSPIKQERTWEQWSWEEKNNTTNGTSPIKKVYICYVQNFGIVKQLWVNISKLSLDFNLKIEFWEWVHTLHYLIVILLVYFWG